MLVQSSSMGMSHSDYAITDPVRVRDLLAFANSRREASRPSLYTMPAPQITATFYDGASFVGAIGAGANFFFVSCSDWKGGRNASADEISKFRSLVGSVDEKHPPKLKE